ncbi:MAG: hypothetical protein R3B60_05280 [Candidatus Paceibacterota bacterium]
MKQRSASYPYYSIEESLDFSQKIYKNYGTTYRAKREEIADALGYSVGSLTQKVSAAVQYGFLDMKSKEGYMVTPLFVNWHRPISEESKNDALEEAFRNPPLYSDLLEVFENNILPPTKPLANILLQKHNISEKACARAAEIFELNAKFVGALSEESRILSFKMGIEEEEQEEIHEEEEVFEQEEVQNNAVIRIPNGRSNSGGRSSADSRNDSVFSGGNPVHVIPLKNKMPAQLLLPSDVSAADFDFIISYIGLIRNQY